MHADLSDARAAGLCPALAVMGESARQSVRQRERTSVNRFMGESFRLNGFKLRLSVRSRRADSTPGNSRGEEKSRAKMRQAERAVDRSCHVGDRYPTRLVISATSGVQVQFPGLTDGFECRAFRRFGCGACPETPHGWEGSRVPKHPAGFMIACKLTGFADTTSPLSLRQIVTPRAAVRID
jgi:hypothetical protein